MSDKRNENPNHPATRTSVAGKARNQQGSALVLAAFVLMLLTGIGVVLLFTSRTEVRSSLADVRSKKAFYFAEAGLESARDQLRVNNAASANKNSFDDELVAAAGGDGAIDLDAAALTPIYNSSGNVTGFNGVDDDVPVTNLSVLGTGWFASYVTNDPVDGIANLDDTNDRLMITAIGGGRDRSVEVVQAIVERVPMPPLPATITLLGPTATFDGGDSAAKDYEGDDCEGAAGYTGVGGLSVPVVGVVTADSETNAEIGVRKPLTYSSGGETGVDTVDNINSTIDPRWTSCADLQLLADLVRSAATVVCSPSTPCSHWASSTMTTITFIEGDAVIQEGRGLLWITGTATMNGQDSWDGVILAVGEGQFLFTGGGTGHAIGATLVANIAGPDGVFGNTDDCTGSADGFLPASYVGSGGGNKDTIYCTDAINQVVLGLPLKTEAFRQR